MRTSVVHLLKKISLWTILIIVATVLIIPVLLYIPAIQEFAKNIAVTEVKKATGMDITLDRISLKFPLRLSLDRLIVIEASGDTMATARQAAVDVRLLPLFKGEIAISGAELDHASYRLGTPDSAMFLKARIEKFKAENTDLNFSFSKIDIGNAALDGADISLVIKDTVTDTPVDTTAANPMLIKAGDIALSRVRFRMSMLPVIDSLGTYIGIASLKNGIIDTGNRSIDVGSLSVDSVTATYLTPSAQWLKTHPQTDSVKPATADSIAADILPWTITARQLSLTAPMAIYAMQGSKPMPGLDMNYIQASRIALQIDSFYNRGTEINVPIKHFSAEERCGITLNARGTFAMDSSAITVSGFDISTLFSHLKADAEMGLGDLTKDPALPLKLITTGTISPVDITAAMPSMRQYFRSLPKSSGLNMDIDINGTAGALDVNKLKLELPHHLSVNANGHVDNPMDFKRMKGKIDINGNLRNANFIKPTLLDAKMARTVNIPPTTIKGTVDYNPGLISGNIAMRTGSGRMAFNGRWNSRAEGYDATLGIDRFPVASFLPTLSIGDVTAHASVNGNGYNPSNRRTHAKARIDIDDITYQGQKLTDLSLDASLDTCRLTGTLASRNPDADLDIDFAATLLPDEYEWDINGDVRHLDMQQLKLSSTPMNGMLSIYTNGTYNPRNGFIDGEAEISNLHWTLDKNTLSAPEIKARLLSTDTLTQASVNSGDLAANLSALCPLDSVLTGVTAFTDTVMRQIDRRNIDVVELQHTLPHMALDMTMGKNNIAADYIADLSGTTFKNAALTFSNDSLLSFRGDISGLVTGSTRLDNIALSANQHGRFLVYHAAVDNKPGTMDNFAHIKLNGFIAADKLSALLKQSNIRNEEGFMIGFNAAVTDSALNVRFVPYKPTIAYKKWDINHDNSVTFNFAEKHLDANLKLMSGDSYLHLYTEHLPDSAMHTQEDVVLQLANINLAEWLSISPFAPPVKGMADADMRFRWDEKQITGNGMVNLTDIYYGRDRVGTFTLDLDVANDNRTGALNADVSLMVDSVKVITATGALNDSTARNPFLLDFSMIRFPLRVVNPFLPKGTAQLSGMLNGRMDITGSMAQPIFNGYLDFDSTAVKVGITGASYKFSEEKIPVDSNIVRFTDFTIGGLNGNDLHVNGTVDARRLSDIQIDLDMRGRDMQIINSSRPRGADAYGKAFIDLDASVKGNMDMLNVNAMLNVLAGTNVTYILSSDAQSALSSQKSEKMVRFVNFADTTQVIDADSITSAPMSINLEANQD